MSCFQVSLKSGLNQRFPSYPKAGSCPLTLSMSKGVSRPLYGTPFIWFDKHVLSVAEVLTMSGVYPGLKQLEIVYNTR